MGKTVGDLMTRDPVLLEPTATVKDAARMMRDRDIGTVLVADKGQLVGVLTDRDIVVRGLAQTDDATKVRAKLAELDLQKEETKLAAAPVTPAPPEGEAQGPSDTLSISNEAAALIARKGPPRSITWRADGLFNLHWDDSDTLVYPDGKLAPQEK